MALARYGRDTLRRSISASSATRCDGITNPVLFSGHGLRYRKLEVILTTVLAYFTLELDPFSFSFLIHWNMSDFVIRNGQTIDKLGKAGETVKVAPGHFRNHLMPKLLAVPNIDKYAFLIREQRKVVVVLLLLIFIVIDSLIPIFVFFC